MVASRLPGLRRPPLILLFLLMFVWVSACADAQTLPPPAFEQARVRARALGLPMGERDQGFTGMHDQNGRLFAAREDENFAGAISVYEQALDYVDDTATEVIIELGLAYVCSSPFVVNDSDLEVRFVSRWLEALRTSSDPRALSRSGSPR